MATPRGRLGESREVLRTRRQLTEAAATWTHLEEAPGALLRGARLEAARPLTQARDAGLTACEKAFLNATLAAKGADITAISQASRRRRRPWLIAASAVLPAVSVTTSLLAVQVGRELTVERDDAVAHNASAEATEPAHRSPALAAQEALAAYRLRPDRRSRDALLSTLMSTLTAHKAETYAVNVSPDGSVLATAGRDRTVRLRGVREPRYPRRTAILTRHKNALYAVAVHPGGSVLVSAGSEGVLILRDIAELSRPHLLSAVWTRAKTVRAVAFGPDGRLLASAVGSDERVILWDMTFTTAVLGPRLTPDGGQVLTGMFDGTATPCRPTSGDWSPERAGPLDRPSPEEWRRHLGGVPYHRPC
ncbi:WD40 repeat domain-containing protein [Streptomyces sp. NPDC001843]|uniref:WD40 repeat domain-containing protein n=1 Tax=Streptomyces sp. NPDC001843 TaxID=3364617 RepID=UPI00369314F4